MSSYELYWKDLTPEAQERLKELNHENIDLYPIAILEKEEEEIFSDIFGDEYFEALCNGEYSEFEIDGEPMELDNED